MDSNKSKWNFSLVLFLIRLNIQSTICSVCECASVIFVIWSGVPIVSGAQFMFALLLLKEFFSTVIVKYKWLEFKILLQTRTSKCKAQTKAAVAVRRLCCLAFGVRVSWTALLFKVEFTWFLEESSTIPFAVLNFQLIKSTINGTSMRAQSLRSVFGICEQVKKWDKNKTNISIPWRTVYRRGVEKEHSACWWPLAKLPAKSIIKTKETGWESKREQSTRSHQPHQQKSKNKIRT